jgi:polyphosphate kinase
MGSADWMGRNLDRRVETVVPILDAALRDYVCAGILDTLERDNCKTRFLRSDGTYERRIPETGEPLFSAHSVLLEAAKAL